MAGQLDFFERVAALGREGAAFAVATVVGRRAPVSAHVGDHAIVFADGRIEGFVGGACAREIVRKHAVEAMACGAGRLVSIRPDVDDAGASTSDRVVVRMTCASEGAVDVYIEPFGRTPGVVVVGATPIAAAVTRVARSLDYAVVRVVDERERTDIEAETAALGIRLASLAGLDDVLRATRAAVDLRAVVVASQGHYDEEAVAAALASGVPYVGLVASRARGTTVRATLDEGGTPGVITLRSPAGLDLGARTPSEVALSILAEIVQLRGKSSPAEIGQDGAAIKAPAPMGAGRTAPAVASDPVCHMDVEVASARHTADVDGITYYFCCAGCRARFVKHPHEFLPQTA